MLLSERILKNPKCLQYAESLDIDNYLDIYHDSWLKIRERELNGRDFSNVKSELGFFITVFKNTLIDDFRKNKNTYNMESLDFIKDINEDNDVFRKFENWIKSDSGNELEEFYKNIIELVSKTKTVTEAINYLSMGRSRFYVFFNEAKKKCIDECS